MREAAVAAARAAGLDGKRARVEADDSDARSAVGRHYESTYQDLPVRVWQLEVLAACHWQKHDPPVALRLKQARAGGALPVASRGPQSQRSLSGGTQAVHGRPQAGWSERSCAHVPCSGWPGVYSNLAQIQV